MPEIPRISQSPNQVNSFSIFCVSFLAVIVLFINCVFVYFIVMYVSFNNYLFYFIFSVRFLNKMPGKKTTQPTRYVDTFCFIYTRNKQTSKACCPVCYCICVFENCSLFQQTVLQLIRAEGNEERECVLTESE